MSVVPLIIGTVQANSQFGGMGGRVLVYAGLFVLWGLVGLIPMISKEPTSKKYKVPPVQPWTVIAPESQQATLARMIADDARTIEGDIKEVSEPRRLATDTGRWGR